MMIHQLTSTLLFILAFCTPSTSFGNHCVRASKILTALTDPPPNDDLANAIALSGSSAVASVGPTTGPNGATLEPDELNCGTTVSWWYAYTPTNSGPHVFNAGALSSPRPESDNDLTLGVYTGTVHPLTEIACLTENQGSGLGSERDTLNLTMGVTYLVRLGATAGAQIEQLFLRISELPPYWTGTISDDWYEPANWSTGRVPTADEAVFISGAPNPTNLSSGTVTVRQLDVVSGGDFNVAEEASLILSGGDTGLEVQDGRATIDGSVLIENQFAFFDLEAPLTIGASGRLEVKGLEASVAFIEDSLVCAGTLIFDNVFGISIEADGVLDIRAGGYCEVSRSSSTSISHAGDEILVEGTLTVTEAGGDGIITNGGDITIGETGILEISDCEDAGLAATSNSSAVINAGQLVIFGTGPQACSADVDNQATATLRGEGAFWGDITFVPGSRLEPGSSPGCLELEQATNLEGVILELEIEGPTSCTAYDQVLFDEPLDIEGLVLDLRGDYVPSIGEAFTLMAGSGIGMLNGTFANLPEGGILNYNGAEMEITYQGGAGNDVVVTTISVLPLDLLSFTGEARDKSNLLSWTTANEENFSHFEVERSPDGQGPWSVLAKPDLQASGEHEYIDHAPLPAALYRLKMVDLDGTFIYSEVVYLENNSGEDAGAMLVYPNPSNGRFTVDLTMASLPAESGGELGLVDLHGRTVWSTSIVNNLFPINVDLPDRFAEVYLLTYQNQSGQRLTQRILLH